MAMNLDAAIRLSATVSGANNIRSMQSSVQGLSQAARLSTSELGRWNIEINRAARAAGNTTAGLRAHSQALTQLRDRVEIGSKAYRRLGLEIDAVEGKLKRLTATQRGVDGGALAGRAAGAVAAVAAAGFAAAPVANAGIDREESVRRLRILSDGFDEFARVQDAATQASERFGISQTEANRSFAQLYARLRPMGFELTTLQSAYNGFNTAAKLSGATSVEASAAFLQLSQALGSGVLRGEELNSVYEQTPAVIQAIAKEMDIPIGQLRAYAKEGKITSDIVLAALARIEAEGAGKLAEAMEGPRQQVVNLQNAFQDLQVSVSGTLMPALIVSIQALTKSVEAATEYAAGLNVAFEAMRPVVDIFAGINRGLDEAITKFPQLGQVIWTAVNTFLPGLQLAADIVDKFRRTGRNDMGRGTGYWNDLPAGAWPEGVPVPGTSAEEARNQAELRAISREGAAFAAAERAKAAAGKPEKPKKVSDADVNRQELERIRRLPFGADIIAAAEANQLDPRLFAGLVGQESSFNPNARGRRRDGSFSGAFGLAQLKPGTAREMGVNIGIPRENLFGGARYLRQQIERFGLEGGLRAYNQGPGAQQATPGGNSPEAMAYPGRVLARARAFGFDGNGAKEGMEAIKNTTELNRLRDQALAAAREALRVESAAYDIQAATDPLVRLGLEAKEKERAINVEIGEQLSKARSDEERKLITNRGEIEIARAQLEYDEKRIEVLREEYKIQLAIQDAVGEIMAERQKELESRSAMAGGRDGVKSYREEIGTMQSSVADFTSSGLRGMEDAFVELATTGKASFKDLAQSVLADLSRMIIRMVVMRTVAQAIGGLFGGGFQGFSGAGPTSFPTGDYTAGFSMAGNLGGPMGFTGAGPVQFANGGIADGPLSGYAATLHGTEAVVPLGNGRSIPVEMKVPFQLQGGAPAVAAGEAGTKASSALAVPFQASAGGSSSGQPALTVPFMKGAATTPAAMAAEAARAMAGAPLEPIDIRYSGETRGGVEWVTRQQMEESNLLVAERVRSSIIGGLRNDPSTRRTVGIGR